MAHHEGHLLGRDFRRSGDEVALVLAVIVIDNDDHLAAGDGVNGVLDRIKAAGGHGRHLLEIFRAHGTLGERPDLERKVERRRLARGKLGNPRGGHAKGRGKILLPGAGGLEPILEFHGQKFSRTE